MPLKVHLGLEGAPSKMAPYLVEYGCAKSDEGGSGFFFNIGECQHVRLRSKKPLASLSSSGFRDAKREPLHVLRSSPVVRNGIYLPASIEITSEKSQPTTMASIRPDVEHPAQNDGTTSNNHHEIVIVGAGIVGLTTALALHKHTGLKPVLYEQAGSFQAGIGAAIGMYPHGLRVLRDIDPNLVTAIRGAGYPYEYRRWIRHDGTKVAVASESALDRRDDRLHSIGIRRWKLQKILFDAVVEAGITVQMRQSPSKFRFRLHVAPLYHTMDMYQYQVPTMLGPDAVIEQAPRPERRLSKLLSKISEKSRESSSALFDADENPWDGGKQRKKKKEHGEGGGRPSRLRRMLSLPRRRKSAG